MLPVVKNILLDRHLRSGMNRVGAALAVNLPGGRCIRLQAGSYEWDGFGMCGDSGHLTVMRFRINPRPQCHRLPGRSEHEGDRGR